MVESGYGYNLLNKTINPYCLGVPPPLPVFQPPSGTWFSRAAIPKLAAATNKCK